MTIGSLFSGIGGLELGLERAGLGPVIWQAESDDYCRRVLAKHWPGMKCFEDVREVDEHAERPDIICGGFPCQDISRAGRRAGIDGEQSSLWGEFARIIRLLRPPVIVVENVPTLLVRGMERVLGDLAASGYDAQWDCIPAEAVGASHIRDRLFIIATHASGRRHGPPKSEVRAGWHSPVDGGGWPTEPDVARVVHGISAGVDRVDRVRALGNAVVPRVAEHIGRCIVDAGLLEAA